LKQRATLHELQLEIQRGTLSCTEIVKYYLSNINRKGDLNAFITVYDKEALERAALIDQKINSGSAGKLAGLVVGIKDVISYKDHPLNAGSKILDGFVAQYNATVVQRLIDEDAIIIGRQNCDEFGMGSSNENSAFGPVLNEEDPTRVPGGSSGGSAVAVQADMCQLSIGSDTGGSVRQPAAFCGLIGFKPTYSRISRYGLVAYGSSFDCIGIIGRYTEDIAKVLEVIAGQDEYDSTVSTKAVPDYDSQISLEKKFKIACFKELMEASAIREDIRETMMSRIENLKAAGHEKNYIDFPLNDVVLPTYYILATAEASSNLSRYDGVRFGYRASESTNIDSMYKRTRTEGFGKEVQRRILLGTFVLTSDYYDSFYSKAQKIRRLVRNAIENVLATHDLILMPTTPTTAFKVGEKSNDPLQMYMADLFSVQANVAGVPAISIPCGKDKNGLPIGLQAIAADFEEVRLFQFSRIMMNFN
jgi:aspartyl-tRNA(Asn)/glutamyl-tRNA(Gln) amidotransferase subunit A